MLLDDLSSQPLEVGDAAARGGAGGPSHKLQELKLHAHLPCLHAELGKRCIATCPATCPNDRNQLDCSGARLTPTLPLNPNPSPLSLAPTRTFTLTPTLIPNPDPNPKQARASSWGSSLCSPPSWRSSTSSSGWSTGRRCLHLCHAAGTHLLAATASPCSYTALHTIQLYSATHETPYSAIHETPYAPPLWSQGHPSPLGSGNLSLESAVDHPAHPAVYEAPFSCALALNGRPVGELTGRLHVIWSGTKPTLPSGRATFIQRQKTAFLTQSDPKHSNKVAQLKDTPPGRPPAT